MSPHLDDLVPRGELPEVISGLESLGAEGRPFSVAAIHILKNQLAPLSEDERRTILVERTFVLPGSLLYRVRRFFRREIKRGPVAALRRATANLGGWITGRDSARFRDRCDRFFWEEVVPAVEAGFDNLAEPLLNTINEAIINYAEHGFRAWSFYRRVSLQVFRTEGDLAYGIVRPYGTRLRRFDPLTLKEKEPGALSHMRRGWGHTLLMRRALFISFDHSPRKRGLMVIVGPES